MMVRTKAKPKKVRTPHILVPPTPERIAKAERYIHRSATGPITVRDAPLEQLEADGRITERQYAAADKYRHHWHHAGMRERFSSLRMDGTFGGSNEHVTDNMMWHRAMYTKAVQALGMTASGVVEDIVCRDIRLVDVGRKRLGWGNDPQARAAAETLLKDALDRLADHWGIT